MAPEVFDPTTQRIRGQRLSAIPLADDAVAVGDPDQQRVYLYGTEHLARAIKTKRVRARQWVSVVARHDCVFRALKLPTTDAAEARQMFEYEVPTLLPLPPDEVSSAMVVLGEVGGHLSVMAVLVPQRRLSALLAALERVSVCPEIIVPSCLALASWACQQTEGADPESTCLWLLPGSSQIEVITGRGVRFLGSRTIERPAVLADLDLSEIVGGGGPSALEGPASGTADRIDKILLVGSDRDWRGIKFLDQEGTEAPLVQQMDPSSVQILVQDGLEEVIRPSTADPLLAVGACQVDRHPGLCGTNLVPPQTVRLVRRRRGVRQIAATAALGICAVALLWGYLVAGNLRLRRYAQQLQTQINPIEDIAETVAQKRVQLRLLRQQLDGRDKPLEILAELHRVTPPTIHLTALTIVLTGPSAEVSIRGQALSLAKAFGFQGHLEGSDLFHDARTEYARQVSRREGRLIEFLCGCKAAPVKGSARERAQ